MMTRDTLTAEHGEHTSYPLRTWDEGFGPLWLYVEACGPWMLPKGVVRAQTWEEAYECCEDEIMDDADPKAPETYARDYDDTAEEGELAEGVCYRSSGVPSCEGLESGLAQYDLGGQQLVRVTKEVLEAFHVRVRFIA